jgi:hypothetical protein
VGNARGNPIKHVSRRCASGVSQLHMRGTDTYAVTRFNYIVIETPFSSNVGEGNIARLAQITCVSLTAYYFGN